MSGRELEGRVALVTGAARNIGRAIALALAQGGASVAVVTRSDRQAADETARLVAECGVSAEVILADVAREDDVAQMIGTAVDRLGGLDILVNNAAIRTETSIEALTYDDWRLVMGVALDGPFLCSKAAIPHLSVGNGTIINIGGLTAYTGASHRAHVVAAKAGLDGLTKALAHELAPQGITVNLISPGLIDTARDGTSSTKNPHHHKHATNLVGRRGHPEEVASMVRYVAGPDARYITGQTIHVNGGAYLP
jgi:3-oxoacyl-[acyl-carrier protein] reductase